MVCCYLDNFESKKYEGEKIKNKPVEVYPMAEAVKSVVWAWLK